MNKVKITINDKVYICQVAETEEERKQGLQNIDYLPPDEGMLFVFDKQGTYKFWMKDTKIPLDQIAINKAETVTSVYTASPESETLIPFSNCKYLLEVNANSGINVGDEVDFDDLQDYTMKVVGSDGSTQMLLKGGERIFSRKSTLKFIRLAKLANEYSDDPENYNKICKKLGKALFKELYAQDHREKQYVELPK